MDLSFRHIEAFAACKNMQSSATLPQEQSKNIRSHLPIMVYSAVCHIKQKQPGMLYHLPTFNQDSKALCLYLLLNMPQEYSLALIFSQVEMEDKNQTSAEVKTGIVNKTLTRKKRQIFFPHSPRSLSSTPLTHHLLLAACCIYIFSFGGK